MKLIGMEPAVTFVDEVCAKAPLHRFCDIAPPHMSIPLDPGGGRSSLLQYILRRYESAGVCQFSGVDKIQEYVLDGSMGQLYSVKRSVYYSIVGRDIKAFDATALKDHLFEHQTQVFLDMIQDLADKHLLVFFCPAHPDQNTRALMERVSNAIPGMTHLQPIVYKGDQLVNICADMLKEREVKFDTEDPDLLKLLWEILAQRAASSPKDVERVVESMLMLAEMRHGRPTLTTASLLSMVKTISPLQATPKKGDVLHER